MQNVTSFISFTVETNFVPMSLLTSLFPLFINWSSCHIPFDLMYPVEFALLHSHKRAILLHNIYRILRLSLCSLGQEEYDILFGGDGKEESEFIPDTIHGKVQALEQLLSKPLVFNKPDSDRVTDADKIKKRLEEVSSR